MIVLARLSRDGHTRPHGVVFRAISKLPCDIAPIDASGVLGRLPAKSGELEPKCTIPLELGAWRGPYHSHCPSRWCHCNQRRHRTLPAFGKINTLDWLYN